MKTAWLAPLLILSMSMLATPCAAAGLSLQLDAPATLYTGTTDALSFVFQKENPGDGLTANPPFTFRLPLPAGITYHGGATTGTWSCAGTAIGAQTIVCSYSGTLTPAQWQGAALTLPIDIAANTPPGPLTFNATLESAQYPLPGTPNCTASPSTTGCVTRTSAIGASSLSIVNWYYPGQVITWPDQPLEGGVQTLVQVGFQNIGYGPGNGTVTLKVELPPRTHFSQAGGSLSFTCAAQTQGDHQIVTCTTPYMITSQTAYAMLYVNVDPDIATPGPVYFHAAIGNAVQPPPTTCSADPYQPGCGRLAIATRPPRVASLAFNGVQHSPGYFTLGQRNGPLVVNFRNLGEGTASATTVALQLPRGFHYAGILASLPALTCASGGDPATTGQTLSCTGAGLPASTTGFVSVNVDLDATTQAPGPVVVLGAIDQSSPASSNTLLACANDPNHAWCFWHEIATFAPCALQYGADGVYCDGFDKAMPQ